MHLKSLGLVSSLLIASRPVFFRTLRIEIVVQQATQASQCFPQGKILSISKHCFLLCYSSLQKQLSEHALSTISSCGTLSLRQTIMYIGYFTEFDSLPVSGRFCSMALTLALTKTGSWWQEMSLQTRNKEPLALSQHLWGFHSWYFTILKQDVCPVLDLKAVNSFITPPPKFLDCISFHHLAASSFPSVCKGKPVFLILSFSLRFSPYPKFSWSWYHYW